MKRFDKIQRRFLAVIIGVAVCGSPSVFAGEARRGPASVAPVKLEALRPRPVPFEAGWQNAQNLPKPKMLMSPQERERQVIETEGPLRPVGAVRRAPASAVSRMTVDSALGVRSE